MTEKLAELAPGRLSLRLRESLAGHHLLFDEEFIRAAFARPATPMSKGDADAVGEALLAIAREPLTAARDVVAALEPTARDALIRLYFRLLDRAGEGKAELH
jgi:hypothetical protein